MEIPTLREWGETWLAARAADGYRAHADTVCYWRCHVLEAHFIDRRLDEIRRSDIRAFLRTRLTRSSRQTRIGPSGERVTVETGRTLSRAMVTKIAQTLHSALRAAVEEELLDANPATGLRLRMPAREAGWTYLSAAEVELVASSPELPDEARTIYLVAIYTGLRKGELWGLRWDDVALDAGRAHLVVSRSFEGPTKTGRVGRVPLIPAARELFEAWSESTERDTHLVFPWRGGARHGRMRGPHCTAGWADYWARGKRQRGWRARLGIERRVRFHDLRHTCASHLLMGTWGRRWRLEEVRDMLRHSSVRETERYAHLAPDALFDAASQTFLPDE